MASHFSVCGGGVGYIESEGDRIEPARAGSGPHSTQPATNVEARNQEWRLPMGHLPRCRARLRGASVKPSWSREGPSDPGLSPEALHDRVSNICHFQPPPARFRSEAWAILVPSSGTRP